jgi:hypothetical protein
LSRPISPLGEADVRIVDEGAGFPRPPRGVDRFTMNDDHASGLEALRAEHRRLDERIQALLTEAPADQLEIARLKKQKLRLKDQIQRIIDSNIPDIIA